MSDEFDDRESEIERLQQEIIDLEAEKNELYQEALVAEGLNPDDPELQDKLNEMDPDYVSGILPDTSYQDERIAEINEEIEQIKREGEEE